MKHRGPFPAVLTGQLQSVDCCCLSRGGGHHKIMWDLVQPRDVTESLRGKLDLNSNHIGQIVTRTEQNVDRRVRYRT